MNSYHYCLSSSQYLSWKVFTHQLQSYQMPPAFSINPILNYLSTKISTCSEPLTGLYRCWNHRVTIHDQWIRVLFHFCGLSIFGSSFVGKVYCVVDFVLYRPWIRWGLHFDQWYASFDFDHFAVQMQGLEIQPAFVFIKSIVGWIQMIIVVVDCFVGGFL